MSKASSTYTYPEILKKKVNQQSYLYFTEIPRAIHPQGDSSHDEERRDPIQDAEENVVQDQVIIPISQNFYQEIFLFCIEYVHH